MTALNTYMYMERQQKYLFLPIYIIAILKLAQTKIQTNARASAHTQARTYTPIYTRTRRGQRLGL